MLNIREQRKATMWTNLAYKFFLKPNLIYPKINKTPQPGFEPGIAGSTGRYVSQLHYQGILKATKYKKN